MRVIQLHSENVKRIKAIDITPTEDIIILSGKNEQGKTSVLDSIWLALEYRAASKENPVPLRIGTDKGRVTLDLGNYIVTRKFTPEGSTLEIKTPDGNKISSPQKLLDGMIGDLSFDPWDFARRTETEQRQMLADVLYKITDGKLDLAAYDQKYKDAFDKRTDANREKKRLATILTTMTPPTGQDPTQQISIGDLTKSIGDAMGLKSHMAGLLARETKLRESITQLENQLANSRIELNTVVNELQALPDVPDLAFLQNQLQNIESQNKRAREVEEYNKTRKALQSVENDIEKLNATMELVDIEKAEALESSPLPISGLKITADGITVTNEEDQPVPICQASKARKLRISVAIAMAANPNLRVIRIADGSLLDEESMETLRSMAELKDFQIWIEYMSRNENDRMGVYIHDGMIESTT